jgi:predicted metal-binding protein
MIQHQKEQKEVLQEFYEYLLVKKRVPKKDLDDIVVCLGDPNKEMEEATRCKVTK